MKRPFETELNNAGAPNASETVKSEASSFGKLADLAARAAEETSRLTNLEPILRIPVTVPSSRGKDDALAGQYLPAAVLVFDFLDAAEIRHILAQHDFDHARLSLENGDAFKGAPHAPAGDDLTSRICRPRLPLYGSGNFGG